MRYVGLLAGIGLILAVTATAGANTVASSTMWFQGSLTEGPTGVYTGIVYMVDEATLGIGDGVAGYDVYAKNGAAARFSEDTDIDPITNHDGWPTWTPDTPDWYQYSLKLTKTGWAVRNHAGSTAEAPQTTPARGVPMSGSMDWFSSIATETDVGAYISGMGTAKHAGWAGSNGGGAGAWDMDWSWGSEVVPLQYADFLVEITVTGQCLLQKDCYYVDVKMTPVPEPVTMAGLMLGIGCLSRYVRRRKV